MLTFFILVSLLSGFCLLYIWRFFKKNWLYQSHRQSVNVDVARSRLKELDDDNAKQESEYITQALASDLSNKPNKTPQQKSNDTITAIFIGSIVLASIAVYWNIGQPDSITRPITQTKDVTLVLNEMEAYLAENPNDIKGLNLIANAYFSSGQYTKAKEKYERILKIDADELPPLSRIKLARIYISLNNGIIGQNAAVLFQHVLNNPDAENIAYKDALFMAGSQAIQKGQNNKAIHYLTELSELLGDSPDLQQQTLAMIAQLQQDSEVNKKTLVNVNVTINDELLANISEQLTEKSALFIILRDADLPFPIGVIRQQVSEFPIKIKVSDSNSMQANFLISEFNELQIQARISISGETTAKPGDIQSEIRKITIPNQGEFEIKLDSRI